MHLTTLAAQQLIFSWHKTFFTALCHILTDEALWQIQHCLLIIIIIIIRHAHQCVAPLAANSLHGGLFRASSIASSKVRLC